MPDLLDIANEGEPEYPEMLEPVRFGKDPTHLIMFTRDVELTELHYVEGPPINSYVPCPGEGCPLCYIGKLPDKRHLLPAVNVAKRAVEVLRIPDRRGPGSLMSGLLPHLAGEDTTEKLFAIARDGKVFKVSVQALGEHADRCPEVIKGFLEAQEAGLKLVSAFPEYSAQELAKVETIRAVLDAVGGWTPPGKEGDVGN